MLFLKKINNNMKNLMYVYIFLIIYNQNLNEQALAPRREKIYISLRKCSYKQWIFLAFVLGS